MMESSVAVSGSYTVAKKRHEIASCPAELAERLIEQQQGDAVFAAGIAHLFKHRHLPEAGHPIEQEENTPSHSAVSLMGGIAQRTDHGRTERRLDMRSSMVPARRWSASRPPDRACGRSGRSRDRH
jgi:hypothetical protein